MKKSLLPRFVSLWLTLSLALPNPAYALREIQTRNSGTEEQELTYALLDRPAAGTEEEAGAQKQFQEFELGWNDLNRISSTPGSKHLVFTPDGRQLVSHNWDELIQIFDVGSGRLRRQFQLERHPKFPDSYGEFGELLSPDGKTLLFERRNEDYKTNLLFLMDLTTGKKTPFAGKGHELAFNSQGNLLAMEAWRSNSLRIQIWDLTLGRPIREFPSNGGHNKCAVFSPDGKRIAAADAANDGNLDVTVWDAETGKKLWTKDKVHADDLAFDPSGTVLAAAYYYGIVLWDATTGKRILEILEEGSIMRDVAFSQDGRWLVLTSYEGPARVYHLPDGKFAYSIKPDDVPEDKKLRLHNPVFNPDGLLAMGGEKGFHHWGLSVFGGLLLQLSSTALKIRKRFQDKGRKLPIP